MPLGLRPFATAALASGSVTIPEEDAAVAARDRERPSRFPWDYWQKPNSYYRKNGWMRKR